MFCNFLEILMFKRLSKLIIIVFIAIICFVPSAWAFCGFYVSKADAKLYNKASQVVIARNGNRTVLTMANDYQGDVKDFALVVPVPVVLKADQVRVGDSKIIEHLDAFSAPRLVEYFDEDPCATNYFNDSLRSAQEPAPTAQESVSRGRGDPIRFG